MSIFKVNQTDFQSITIATNPSRYYSSSSSGITGSINVFARRSSFEKDIGLSDPDLAFNETTVYGSWINITNTSKYSQLEADDLSIEIIPIIVEVGSLKPNIFSNFLRYEDATEKGFLKEVNDQATSLKKQKTLDIVRFNPPYYFTTGTLKKLAIKDNLSHYYRTAYPSAHWAYSNYHSLNFFSSSTVPTSSVLLYPNDDDGTKHLDYATGRYALSGAFSFDFYINPRYRTLDSTGHFKAGTIFHLSSSYALSLITGSKKDVNGLPATFRLQLQLSHSADISPSLAKQGGYPGNLVFLSEDNALSWNNWHHVVVRWGTNLVNHGTGSFNVDGVDKGTFVIPSGTVAPLSYLNDMMNPTNPDVLCVGNYYEGRNIGNDRLKRFFAADASKREGLLQLDATTSINEPSSYSFKHPLQAEIHDLSIKRFYVTDADIVASSSTGLSNTKDVSFYLPPFFVASSSIKLKIDNYGGLLQTPAIEANGFPTTPFSTVMSFGVGGHYINTENFLKDFASSHFPRQLFLTASTVATDSSSAKTANEILYSQPAVRKRNLLLLPCDDGNFYPNYDLLKKESYQSAYLDDLGNSSGGAFIDLKKLQSESSILSPVDTVNKSFEGIDDAENQQIKQQIGFYYQRSIAASAGSFSTYLNSLTTSLSADQFYQNQLLAPTSTVYKTRDSSSNQVVFFDISNLYYGTRILPGSFTIADSAVSGSGGSIGITIKDNGNGTLYRADSLTPHCTWNSVGTIFYNEGIVVIKSPHLYFFGKDQYEMSFKGEQNLHVLRLEAIAPVNHLNSSSNPTYKFLPSSLQANESDKNYVYVSGINFHDDNLNVIMKTQLAQPIMKRHSEKLLFKVKYDF
jgi:hypothetical protein